MKRLLDKLFPAAESTDGRSSRLVSRGLDALRMARDARAVTMGDVRRVPSHLELRIASPLYDELSSIDALNDLSFHLKDEMMRDLSREKAKTFGDHTIHVTIAADSGLAENEIYAVVRNPERRSDRASAATDERSGDVPASPRPSSRPAPVEEDATRVLGEEQPEVEEEVPEQEEDRTVVLDLRPTYRLVASKPDGTTEQIELTSERCVVGRTAIGERPLPEGFVKIDLELPKTVSREQVTIIIEEGSLLVERIGAGPVRFADDSELDVGASRRLPFGDPIIFDGGSITVEEV